MGRWVGRCLWDFLWLGMMDVRGFFFFFVIFGIRISERVEERKTLRCFVLSLGLFVRLSSFKLTISNGCE